jgi:membrane carboxypeptidase/penicillin-binding protein
MLGFGARGSGLEKTMHIPFISKILPIISGSFRLLKGVFTVVATIVIVSTIAFVSIYFYFARDLPEIRTLEDYRPPVITEVFADKGEKVGEFWLECRLYYPYEKIPKRVVQAFLSAEDARFFEHKGVDMRSILRAVIANIRAHGVAQGGSTITQQITRSLLLTRERTVSRKVKEAILATRLERRLNKEQILTLYLNQIFLGNRSQKTRGSFASTDCYHRWSANCAQPLLPHQQSRQGAHEAAVCAPPHGRRGSHHSRGYGEGAAGKI